MNTVNLKEAVEQSLRLMEQTEARAKTVKGYRDTGFGSITRHFTAQGIFVNFGLLYENFLSGFFQGGSESVDNQDSNP